MSCALVTYLRYTLEDRECSDSEILSFTDCALWFCADCSRTHKLLQYS